MLDDLRATYTLGELSGLLGLDDSRKLERLLLDGEVPIHGRGRGSAKRVWISELRLFMPEVWDSLVEKLSVERQQGVR